MKQAFLAAALLLAPIATWAADAPAKPATHPIDMTAVLTDLTGAPMKDPSQVTPEDKACDKCGPLTLGHAVMYSLLAAFPDEQSLPGDQRWARGTLAMRIKDDHAAELSAEELTVIKRCLGKYYGPLVVTEAFPLLDPNATPPKVQ